MKFNFVSEFTPNSKNIASLLLLTQKKEALRDFWSYRMLEKDIRERKTLGKSRWHCICELLSVVPGSLSSLMSVPSVNPSLKKNQKNIGKMPLFLPVALLLPHFLEHKQLISICFAVI